MSSFASKSNPHPLDPLTVEEVRAASQTLVKQLQCAKGEVRFKVVDLAEPPKDLTLQHLHHNRPAPDRKARVYYHLKTSQTLMIAIVNITKDRIERTYGAPDSQGPVDWVEFELINRACTSHPEVLAEVAKLKLPPQ